MLTGGTFDRMARCVELLTVGGNEGDYCTAVVRDY
jgi:hypothetical protein